MGSKRFSSRRSARDSNAASFKATRQQLHLVYPSRQTKIHGYILMKHTKESLFNLSAESFIRLRASYYDMSDAIMCMKETEDSLHIEEVKALRELEAAFAKLDHLGKYL